MTTTRAQQIYLLEAKKQIILFGPPGTGKTYSTKRLAVSLIDGFDSTSDLRESDELLDTEPAGQNNIVSTPLFSKIESSIKSLSGIEMKPSDTMINYSSFSRKMNKQIGLVWLDYPKSIDSFRVHLRKETKDTKYPQAIASQLKRGFGDYPYFVVKNDQDADNAIELIKYAYKNL
jgi:adenylate kinase family enzyme